MDGRTDRRTDRKTEGRTDPILQDLPATAGGPKRLTHFSPVYVSYRNQSFVLICKTNGWFLYKIQWAKMGSFCLTSTNICFVGGNDAKRLHTFVHFLCTFLDKRSFLQNKFPDMDSKVSSSFFYYWGKIILTLKKNCL